MSQRRFTFGRVMPALIAAIGLADLITRGLPVDAFTFRAWEAMIYYRQPDAAFEASHRYDRCSYGDLSNLANLPKYRTYRRELFTTDKLGFRNPEGLADSGRVKAILIGDSFGAGSGVADEDTLAAQLGTRGVTTYNVAPMRLDVKGMQAMAARLRMDEGWILFQQVTGLRYAYLASASVTSAAPRERPSPSFYYRFERNLHTPTFPLRIMADRWLKSWQDGRWFSNPYAKSVEVRRLRNHDTMLFFAGETIEPTLPRHALDSIETTVALYRGVNEQLRSTGLRLKVLLVPDRFTAYAHLLETGAWTGGMPPYQQELDRHLRAAGVPVINLYDVIAAGATAAAENYEYLYWRDDTHWNAAGIRVAAAEIAARLQAEGQSGTSATGNAEPSK
jgi:hypothetical protein